MRNKIFSMLVLLAAVVTGAWADTTVTWTASDMSGIYIDFWDGEANNNTIKGITVTSSGGGSAGASWERTDIELNGGSTTITFTSSVGKIKSIAITAENIDMSSIPSGWTTDYSTLSWSGVASTTVPLPLSGWTEISGISGIVFTIESTVNVTGITLDKTEASMIVGGETLTLTPTVAPGNATDKTVTWTSSDADVATVTNGVVSAVAAGTATITATATNGTADTSDDKTATCTVTVTAPAPATTTNYYLVGTMNDWGASKQFQLTQNPYNTNEYMITLTLKEGDQLKVIGVEEGKETVWYPGGSDPNYVVSATGEYTVYCRHDGQGGDGWYKGCLYLAAAPAPAVPVTDLGNNTWQFTMPDYAVVANIEYDTELELREENVNTTVLADWDGYEANVTLKRTLKANGWNTFAAPFSTDIPSGWVVKELESSEFNSSTGELKLNFADANSIEAGKPYLVKVTANADLSAAAFQGTIVNKTTTTILTSAVDFIPTLGKTTIEGNAKKILFISGNTLKHPQELPADMKGFRAYFQLKGDAANAASFNLDFGNGETTGINSLTSEPSSNGEGSIYSLDGRRLSGKPAQKGVYIVNGKKMVIK